MNETELRTLLADRAGSVTGQPDRYRQVRSRVAARQRAQVAGIAAAVLLTLMASIAVVPGLRGRETRFAGTPLGWPPRGSFPPELLDVIVKAWGGSPEHARPLYNSLLAQPSVAVFEARARGGRPVVVFAELRATASTYDRDSFHFTEARIPAGARQVSLWVTDDTGRGMLLVVPAPGIDDVRVIEPDPGLGAYDPMSVKVFVAYPCSRPRIELLQGGQVVATENPTAVRRLPRGEKVPLGMPLPRGVSAPSSWGCWAEG